MWQPLVRARRCFAGRPTARRDGEDPRGATADLSYALGRPELDHLITALEGLPGVEPGRPDTPARLEAALCLAIDRSGGRGSPTVTRRPAGLYTPEAWQIDLADADVRTRTTLERAIHGEGPD